MFFSEIKDNKERAKVLLLYHLQFLPRSIDDIAALFAAVGINQPQATAKSLFWGLIEEGICKADENWRLRLIELPNNVSYEKLDTKVLNECRRILEEEEQKLSEAKAKYTSTLERYGQILKSIFMEKEDEHK